VFIYLVVIHAGYLMYSAIVDKDRRISSIVSAIIIAAPVAWVFLWSPLTFFSDANFQSSALRAAVLSDHETVSCVEGEQIKQVLGAYVRSINADPSVEDKLSKAKTYIERYYIFALANSYRLDQPSHPMYKEEGIRQIVDASQGSVLARVVEAAANCNRWRNTDFTIQVVRTSFGIAPGMRPFTPSDFFNFPLSFYLSCVALLLALLVLVAEQRYTLVFLTAYAVSLHLAMVFIVALKQGGESRYTNTTEPLFILGAGMGGAAVIQTLLRLASRRFQRITLPRQD